MEFDTKFKVYLLDQKNKPSGVTVKNYLADVRKFIHWFENRYNHPFDPKFVTFEVANAFKNQINSYSVEDQQTGIAAPSARSVKRYLSSLRKFFYYLKSETIIASNPFEESVIKAKQAFDPLDLKAFKDYLYISKASDLTIKNYIVDVRHFLNWAKQVLANSGELDGDEPFLHKLNAPLIEEYKDRLLRESNLSPLSINRKLSSLRKYLNWAAEKNIIKNPIQLPSRIESNLNNEPDQTQENNIEKPEVSLQSLIKLEDPNSSGNDLEADSDNESHKLEHKYSRFGPLRFFQKSKGLVTLLFDSLILLSIIKSIEAIKYDFWKATGRKVFLPLKDIVEAEIEKTDSVLPAKSNLLTGSKSVIFAKKFLNRLEFIENKAGFNRIRNIPKSFYAPLRISTQHLPLKRKIIYFLRHSRPKWYNKYHSYSIVHYFHFAIFIIFATAIGFGLYQSFIESPSRNKPVLAALPSGSPRILSFQARLTDASNNPITSATPLRFAIYNSQTASGSALLWEEQQSVTPDQDGVFSTLLGQQSPISQSLFANNSALYLGVTVGTDAELVPRQQLASVAYAQNSATLQGLPPITQANAGTNNVVLALDSSGNLTIGGSATPTFQATGGQFKLSGQILLLTTNTGSNSNIKIAPDGSGIIDLQKPLQNTSNYNNVSTALGAVEVDDIFAILATSSGQSALTISQNSNGPLISASTSGAAKFTVSNAGAGTFASDLAVNGNNFTTTATTFNFANATTTTLNVGGAATSVSVGASTGTTTVNNSLTVTKLATFNAGVTTPSGQSLTVSGNVASNLVPSSNNTYNLGSSSNYWNNGYITNLFSASSATTSGFFQRNIGAIAPLNISDDFLVAGSSTKSALFQIFGLTGNATTSGTFTFNTTGNITTTKNQTLTLGGNTTGNIVLSPLNGTGTVTFSNFTTNGGLAYANGSGVLAQTTAGSSNQCLISSGGGAPTWANCALGSATNWWTSTNGAVYPINTTLDLLLGATATTSGKFGFINVAGGTPTASISANSGNNATYLTGDGTLGTTNRQNITIGSSSTGSISLAPAGSTALFINNAGSVGIGTTIPAQKLSVVGGIQVQDAATQTKAYRLRTSGSALDLEAGGNDLYLSTWSGADFSGTQYQQIIFSSTGNPINFQRNFYPGNAGLSMGLSANYWANTFSTRYNLNSSAYVDGTTAGVVSITGNVGINTTSPGFKLDVQDSQAATAAAQFFNTNTGADADGLIVKLGNSLTTTVATTNHFLSFETAGIGIVGSIQGNGGKGIQLAQSGIADWAEYMKKDSEEQIPFGSLVCIRESGNTYACDQSDGKILGVASEHPTVIAGENRGSGSVPVGLTGLVKTRVSSKNGEIKPGDMITLSDISGVGVKADKAGIIVGRALEGYFSDDPNALGSILVSIHVSWFDPEAEMSQIPSVNIVSRGENQFNLEDPNGNPISRVGIFTETIIGNIKAGLIKTQHISSQSLALATEDITVGGQTIRNYITEIVEESIRNTQNRLFTPQIISGVAQVDTLATNVISPLSSDSEISLRFENSKLTLHADKNATTSAVASFDNHGNARFAGDIEARRATFSGTLSAKDLVTGDATLSGTLHAKKIVADEIEGLDGRIKKLSQDNTATASSTTNITNIYNTISSQSGTITPVPASYSALFSPTSSFSGLLENDPYLSLITKGQKLMTDYPSGASFSAELAYVPRFKSEFASINQGLMVFGPSSLSDVSVTGQLSIGANMVLADNSINTLGTTLQIQSLRQGNLSIMGGLLTVDTDGNLNVSGNATFGKDVTVRGKLAANIIRPVPDSDLVVQLDGGQSSEGNKPGSSLVVKDKSGSQKLSINQLGDILASGSGKFGSIATQALNIVRGAQADTSLTETVASGSAGWAVIIQNEKERTIVSPYVTRDSLIYITPISDTQGLTPYIARQTEEDPASNTKGSFTIQIPTPVTRDIKLNWWIIN